MCVSLVIIHVYSYLVVSIRVHSRLEEEVAIQFAYAQLRNIDTERNGFPETSLLFDRGLNIIFEYAAIQ